MSKLGALVVVGLLCSSSQAIAAWVPSHYRCTFDQLDQVRAEGRQKWAVRSAGVNPYNRPGTRDGRFWATIYTDEAREAKDKGVWLYPVYVDPDDAYLPWKGPGSPGSTSAAFTASQIESIDPKVKPVQVIQDGVCEPGCYTPDQRILFAQGPVEIAQAQQTGLADVLTLTPGSSFGQIAFMRNAVLYYTLDQKPAKQQILIFHMVSGGTLTVTLQHPLVTASGSLRRASEFVAGEHLIRQDGSPDEIVEIETKTWTGQAYNLKPVTTDFTSNILVAEGYLNGSGRFQSEYVEELNRILLRRNVPDSLIPKP